MWNRYLLLSLIDTCIVKVMVFPVVMYECVSWTIKKAECQRIDAFELWCWRRFLRVPWTTRRSNQSILKEISPVYSLESLMLKMKLQYFGHLMRRANSLEKTLKLGKIEAWEEADDRGWDGWMASLTQWIWVWVSSGSWWWTGKPGVLQSMGSQKVWRDLATEQQERKQSDTFREALRKGPTDLWRPEQWWVFYTRERILTSSPQVIWSQEEPRAMP